MADEKSEVKGDTNQLEEGMPAFMNPMLRGQLYNDGYVICYSGLKTRKFTADQIDMILATHVLHPSSSEELTAEPSPTRATASPAHDTLAASPSENLVPWPHKCPRTFADYDRPAGTSSIAPAP